MENYYVYVYLNPLKKVNINMIKLNLIMNHFMLVKVKIKDVTII